VDHSKHCLRDCLSSPVVKRTPLKCSSHIFSSTLLHNNIIAITTYGTLLNNPSRFSTNMTERAPNFQDVPRNRSSKTRLPETFRPLPYSVVMGRGSEPARATGNRRLRILVVIEIENYVKAKSQKEKSFVVARIFQNIQEACPEGAFIKFDGKNWWEVEDNKAREKIGFMFRDCLSDQYRSSTKNKVAKRRALKTLL
jgi:hypothetical protein